MGATRKRVKTHPNATCKSLHLYKEMWATLVEVLEHIQSTPIQSNPNSVLVVVTHTYNTSYKRRARERDGQFPSYW